MEDYGSSKLSVIIGSPDKTMGYQVVRFRGDMDKVGLYANRAALEACVEHMEEAYLVFDFTELNFINSESIGFLLTIHVRLSKKGKTVVLVNAVDHVKDVLQVIGLFSMMKYFDSLKAFEESLKK